MEIVALDVSTEGVLYAPDWRDNRDKPAGEQMVVRILPLSGRELKKLQAESKSSIRPKKTSDVLAIIEDREAKVKEDILRTKIAEVINLKSRSPDGTIAEITTSAQLIELCLSGPADLLGLLSEIFDAIVDQSKLEEGLVKN